MPITRLSFLKTPLPFSLSSPLILLAKHHPFSPPPPFLFPLSNPKTNTPVNSTLNLNLRSLTYFSPYPLLTLFHKHLHLYFPFLCSTTFNLTLHLLITLHAFSKNKTVRFVIQIKANTITFL